ARVSAEVHERAARRTVFAVHDVVELIARRGGAGVEKTLDVDSPFAFLLELEVIVESFDPCDLGEAVGNASENGQVVLAVVERLDPALPDLQEWIRTGRCNLKIFKFHP